MKKRLALIPAVVVTAFGLSLNGLSAEIPVGQELINKAHKIEGFTAELSKEFGRHYAHVSTYRHLMSDLTEMRVQAEHIHGLTHDPYGSLRHLRADVTKLDQLNHHLHRLVDVSERRAAGHVHGKTGHVHELLATLTRTIHNMKFTIARISRPACAIPTRGHSAPRHTKAHVVRNHFAGNFNRGRGHHGHRH